MTQLYKDVIFVQETTVSPMQFAVNYLSKALFKDEVKDEVPSTIWIAFPPLPVYNRNRIQNKQTDKNTHNNLDGKFIILVVLPVLVGL